MSSSLRFVRRTEVREVPKTPSPRFCTELTKVKARVYQQHMGIPERTPSSEIDICSGEFETSLDASTPHEPSLQEITACIHRADLVDLRALCKKYPQHEKQLINTFLQLPINPEAKKALAAKLENIQQLQFDF